MRCIGRALRNDVGSSVAVLEAMFDVPVARLETMFDASVALLETRFGASVALLAAMSEHIGRAFGNGVLCLVAMLAWLAWLLLVFDLGAVGQDGARQFPSAIKRWEKRLEA